MWVALESPKLTPAALKHVEGLPHLQSLSLKGATINDDWVAAAKGLPVERFWVYDGSVTRLAGSTCGQASRAWRSNSQRSSSRPSRLAACFMRDAKSTCPRIAQKRARTAASWARAAGGAMAA